MLKVVDLKSYFKSCSFNDINAKRARTSRFNLSYTLKFICLSGLIPYEMELGKGLVGDIVRIFLYYINISEHIGPDSGPGRGARYHQCGDRSVCGAHRFGGIKICSEYSTISAGVTDYKWRVCADRLD